MHQQLNATTKNTSSELSGDRLARVAISLMCLPGDERIGEAVQIFGAQGAIEQWRSGNGSRIACERVAGALQQAKLVFESAQGRDISLLIPSDTQWPTQVDDLDTEAPIGLWLRGNLNLAQVCMAATAIVGARASTAYGQQVAAEVGTAAADYGHTVVSGAAFGIDAAAHRGALAAGGVTVAVLACGVDVAYPSAHQGLLNRIATDGLIVSEVPPGTTPRKNYFLVRNRIIAALASQTVVVEAAVRSGALSTAHWAQDLGRVVWGVPGPITSASSAGVHTEIHRGLMQLVPTVQHPFI